MRTPAAAEVVDSLRECVGEQWTTESLVLESLGHGLSASAVWRVGQVDRPSARFILKIPDWQDSPVLRLTSKDVLEREPQVVRSRMLDDLIAFGIVTARALAVDSRRGHTWIWMEDVGDSFGPVTDREQARAVVRQSARLHAYYRTRRHHLAEQGWLSRAEHRRYAHLLPQARRNLETLGSGGLPSVQFSPREIDDLGRALDCLDWVDSEMARLPLTLNHGDFHSLNVGLRPADGAMVVLDWAHVGLGPVGCDVATFISQFRLFGGAGGEYGTGFDEELVAAYCRAVQAVDPPTRADQIEQACGLWHLSWGLHLRLGAGLEAIFTDRILEEDARRAAEIDVREGCLRALSFLHRHHGASRG